MRERESRLSGLTCAAVWRPCLVSVSRGHHSARSKLGDVRSPSSRFARPDDRLDVLHSRAGQLSETLQAHSGGPTPCGLTNLQAARSAPLTRFRVRLSTQSCKRVQFLGAHNPHGVVFVA